MVVAVVGHDLPMVKQSEVFGFSDSQGYKTL